MKNQLTELLLTPAQQCALNGLMEGLRVRNTVVLEGGAGAGKTTILEAVHRIAGGVMAGARQFIQALSTRHADAVEEAFLAMIEDGLAKSDLVIVDDLHLVTRIVESCSYPRACLLDAALTAILADAAALGKKMLFAVEGDAPWPLRRRAHTWHLEDFTGDDGGMAH
jgi:ABC-type transport system involved in cytochrome c biogenesis ATPase subunit